MKHLVAACLAVVSMSACSSSDRPSFSAEAEPTSTTQAAPSSVPSTSVSVPETVEADQVEETDLVNFLVAAERSVEGSVHEGTFLDQPEVYIAAAQTFCARLDADDPLTAIVDEFLLDFAGTSLTESSPDDVLLVSTILGAGIETMCPSESGVLDDD